MGSVTLLAVASTNGRNTLILDQRRSAGRKYRRRIFYSTAQRTKTGRLWVYARDQRGWSGPEPPAAFLNCPLAGKISEISSILLAQIRYWKRTFSPNM